MIFLRGPKNGSISRVHLQFSSQADLYESIQAAIRMARTLSHHHAGCRIRFRFEGVEIEVSEFSNADDLMSYYFMRRRMRPGASGPEYQA